MRRVNILLLVAGDHVCFRRGHHQGTDILELISDKTSARSQLRSIGGAYRLESWGSIKNQINKPSNSIRLRLHCWKVRLPTILVDDQYEWLTVSQIEHDPRIRAGDKLIASAALQTRRPLRAILVEDQFGPWLDAKVVAQAGFGIPATAQVTVETYQTQNDTNVYAWDYAGGSKDLAYVAEQLDRCIRLLFPRRRVLVRALQSALHPEVTGRDELIQIISRHGTDRYLMHFENAVQATDAKVDTFALDFRPMKGSSTLSIFEGFHKWKPKSDALPQYCIDIVLIFDARAYKKISFIHKRHGAKTEAYVLKKGYLPADALLGVISIN